MQLHGQSIVEGKPTSGGAGTLEVSNPKTGEALGTTFHFATTDDVKRAGDAAAAAMPAFQSADRAAFLRAIADEIEAIGDALLDRYCDETALPRGRAQGERGRTCGQLRNFASQIEAGDWNRPTTEAAEPNREPQPKPALHLHYIALGPVAVFSPVNFPLAYGVAGGDTASAFAAGCPVIAKSHPSQPGTCEMVGQAVAKAAEKTGMPAGVFALLVGETEVGQQMVDHPEVRAVGFTGSEDGGRAIYNQAAKRDVPIPVFAEMSSLNPVVVLPGHFNDKFVDGLVGSVTLGVGQFCTKPGLVLVQEGADFSELKDKLAAPGSQTMLNAGVRSAYMDGCKTFADATGVEVVLAPEDNAGPGGCDVTPALMTVTAEDFGKSDRLAREVFGPVTLIATYRDLSEITAVLDRLGGQLTATLHAGEDEARQNSELVHHLMSIAGRVIFNGFPTGVEVSPSMVHGGPYPATTDARFTAVGDRAIDRFLRPVCLQSAPAAYTG